MRAGTAPAFGTMVPQTKKQIGGSALAGHTGDNDGRPVPELPATAGVSRLRGPLDRVVADAYADVLKEPVPERMLQLLETIRRAEAGRDEAD
mgnify:CR=1 FL=1